MRYDCSKCPAYCCTYPKIDVSERDIARLASHFSLTPEEATARFTKVYEGERVLRHKKDTIFKTACTFLDLETRRCTVYDSRPKTCRSYPEDLRCGYYEFLKWERERQDDPEFIP